MEAVGAVIAIGAVKRLLDDSDAGNLGPVSGHDLSICEWIHARHFRHARDLDLSVNAPRGAVSRNLLIEGRITHGLGFRTCWTDRIHRPESADRPDRGSGRLADHILARLIVS